MKKLLLVLLAAVAIAPLSWAGRGASFNNTLSAVGADTTAVSGNASGASSYILQYTAVVTPATLSIKLQSSILGDFSDALDCGTASTVVGSGSILNCSGIFAKVRVNITTLTGAGASINYTLTSVYSDQLSGVLSSSGYLSNWYCITVTATNCLPALGNGSTISTQEGGTATDILPTSAGGQSLPLGTHPYALNNAAATFTYSSPLTAFMYPQTTSATNTAQVVTIDMRNLHDTLAITDTCSAGTAALTVDMCTEAACTNAPLTIDSLAAALTQIKQYTSTTVGATVALSPLAARYIRVTVASCGVGNTSTLKMWGK